MKSRLILACLGLGLILSGCAYPMMQTATQLEPGDVVLSSGTVLPGPYGSR